MEENEIKDCIVKIQINGSHGTGFFIEKNKVLTCSHVIKDTLETDIKVIFNGKEYSVEILDKKEDPTIDLAILKVEVDNENFFKIDKVVSREDKFLTYGFAEEESGFIERGAVPITFEYEGDEKHLMKFKGGQFEEGHSGSPIINLTTKLVCGVLNASRNTDNSLGGYGIPIDKLESFGGIIPQEAITINPKIILFTPYTKRSEPYYLPRAEDTKFVKTLDINNIWIFGASGQGKTALIHRNLIQQNIEYIFCDLSSITITSSNDILLHIIYSIKEIFDDLTTKSEENQIIEIANLLKQIDAKKVVIVIDEMSVDDIDLLKRIAESFLSLITHYTNSEQEESLTFVISTRVKPQDIIFNKSKASGYFEYICCDTWKEYIERLFDTLCIELRLDDIQKYKDFILTQMEASPRILKNFFRKILTCEDITKDLIEQTVKETIEECV